MKQYGHMEMGQQLDDSNRMPPELSQLHELVRRTRGLRKRRRIIAFGDDIYVNHCAMADFNVIGPYTAIILSSTIKLEPLADIDPCKWGQFNQMMELTFEDITVHNFLEELIPVDYKWFQLVANEEWLHNNVSFRYFFKYTTAIVAVSV